MGINKVVVRSQNMVAFSILAAALASYGAASVAQKARSGARPASASAWQNGMLVRMSEIEIHPKYLGAYKIILKEEAEASVRLEPGVVSIFPMVEQKTPTQVRILEIYASRSAYQSHLKTPHFQKYKTTTLKMVKSLRLVDMQAMDAATMPHIFRKMRQR